MSGGFTSTCKPAQELSYISMCGSADFIAGCNADSVKRASEISKSMRCTGAGEGGAPIVERLSATSTCTKWDKCPGGNFVEACVTDGLPPNISGHLSPADISFVRPGSDLDFPRYSFEKFSLLVEPDQIL